jgi:superfamily II DNA helicase RecQ
MFAIPAQDPASAEEELNSFLRTHRVLSVDRQLVQRPESAFWAVCVQFLAGGAASDAGAGKTKERVDYKEVLSAEDFAVFARLRDLRKSIAEKEAVPPYTVFTNEQLAAMVSQKPRSIAALGRIDGIGESRLEKYGAVFLTELQTTGKEGSPAA